MVGSVGCSGSTGSGRFVKRREIQRESRIDQNATVTKSGSTISVAAQSPPLEMNENALASAATTTVIVSSWRSGSLMVGSMPLPPCSTPGARTHPPYNGDRNYVETKFLSGKRARCSSMQ